MRLSDAEDVTLSPADRRKRSCRAMAELLSREFEHEISPDAVDLLFDRYWNRLSDLAHSIHANRGDRDA